MSNPDESPPAVDQPEPELAPAQTVWPGAPPKFGEIYGFVDGYKVGMVAMTHETWKKINDDISAMQLHAAKIRAENIVLIQEKEQSGRGRVVVLS